MLRFLRAFRISCPWRRRKAWHWVLLNCPTRVIAAGPFEKYKDALRMALNSPDSHPRIVVELSWRHPWINPRGNAEGVIDEADSALPVIAGTKLDSVHIDECLLPPTED